MRLVQVGGQGVGNFRQVRSLPVVGKGLGGGKQDGAAQFVHGRICKGAEDYFQANAVEVATGKSNAGKVRAHAVRVLKKSNKRRTPMPVPPADQYPMGLSAKAGPAMSR